MSEEQFASAAIESLPPLLFPFGPVGKTESEERESEFPHYYTRMNPNILKIFSIDLKRGQSLE